MQGNWTVTVKSKSAAFPQRFLIQGAFNHNGPHPGTPGSSLFVMGNQWSIAIQNDPGTGFQGSSMQLKFPHKNGGNYEFDIVSNDAGGDEDYNDLILTCSTPVNINDFLIYGNVTLYSKQCIFNPCRKYPFVIETVEGLAAALRNDNIRRIIEKLYPERIPPIPGDPNPPDPGPYFKPMVFDLTDEAMQPKTSLNYIRKAVDEKKKVPKSADDEGVSFAASEFQLVASSQIKSAKQSILSAEKLELSKYFGGIVFPCLTDPGSNLSLSFEEYDRTAAELAGGGYTGTGNRRILGDAITDMNGNYIFRFRFDMSFPGLEDAFDITAGEDVNKVMFPDVIVKIVDYSPFEVKYESAPFYNIPNLKRIDLCLPESVVHRPSVCFNGNLIGSLGNVFISGNQNTAGSTSAAATTRHGGSNYLESTGKISVNSPQALFNVECAAWGGVIDMFGCMYDFAKKATDNKIKWYTIRIRRAGTPDWIYITQNYKHLKLVSGNWVPADVGPFYPNVGGTLNGSVPAYINIQREIVVDNVPWRQDKSDRYMQLDTALYDVIAGERKPGKFYVQVDCYDGVGLHVLNATDLVALFIHNLPLRFKLTSPGLPPIPSEGCGLYRLTDLQLKTPMKFSFQASDPYGFVNQYSLTMGRCPGTALDLNANIEGNFTITGGHTFPGGSNPSNVHSACPGYKGTESDYFNADPIDVTITPTMAGDGWIKPGEYFTVYTFGLTASQRVTNGYNVGIQGPYQASSQIMMERLNP
jgi:hypothetical protein